MDRPGNLPSASLPSTSGSEQKARAIGQLEPRLRDLARMIDHLLYMLQHTAWEQDAWGELLRQYQLFQVKCVLLPPW